MAAYVRAVMLTLGIALAWAGAGLSGCVFYLNPLCNDQIRNDSVLAMRALSWSAGRFT